MIHDELVRQFEATPQPSLSPEFSMTLRRRLRSEAPVPATRDGWRSWIVRLYWVAAAMMVARYFRPVALTPLQMASLTVVGAAIVLTLRGAVRMGSLTRVFREALKR